MTQEQIERAAKEYAETEWYTKRTLDVPGMGGHIGMMERAFIAGAEARQAEIEELDKELDIVHNCLTDLFERQYSNDGERIGRIQSYLSEIEKLKK